MGRKIRNITPRTTLLLCVVLLFSAGGLRAQSLTGYVNRNIDTSGLMGATDPFEFVERQPAPRPPGAPIASTNLISAHDLAVPPKAAKEFQKALRLLQSRDFQSASSHLEKAVQIDPSFVQARNNLGASYLGLEKYDKAAEQFQKAIELDSKIPEPYGNLALALMLLHRFPEAETAARSALALGPQRPAVRFNLGRILAAEGSGSPEAAEILRSSVPEFPLARLALAQVLLAQGTQGARSEAADQLRAYLRKPDPATKPLVQCWLAEITRDPDQRPCASLKRKP
jgi:Flp pilus assembly protein TadD